MRRFAPLGALVCSIVVLCATPARAQTPAPAGWTVEPASVTGATTDRSFFDYSVAPGTALQDYVKVSNLSGQAQTFTFYAADGYTTAQGGFALRLRDQPREAVGAWVSLPFGSQTVAPGTSITFPLQLGVPQDAPPGDYAGGVVAAVVGGPAPSAPGVRIEQGVAARIYVRVQGPLHASLSITRLESSTSGGAWSPFGGPGRATVTYTVVNSGNVRLTGTAHVDLVDAFGNTVASLGNRELPELLPRDSVTVTDRSGGLPLLGMRYHAHVTLTAPDVRSERDAPSVWHVSVPVGGVAIAALVTLLLLSRSALRRLARRRRARTAAVLAT